ncbi:MAG TPA: glycosidase [Puia sp.]|jgi:4-O-beta-D-mannosyl-D-glucose phosphorylase|nr:glycosidase [Puia sp.]
MKKAFTERHKDLLKQYKDIVERKNKKVRLNNNGAFNRFKYPVLTSGHIPLSWRYDLNEKTNPFLLERIGINAVLNPGAIRWKNKYLLMARVEGIDRKSFFAIAESENGIDNFTFWKRPITMPALNNQETNFYDIRITVHEDGWIYGLFCTEMRDPSAPDGDHSSAIAQCGISRTKDMVNWVRLKNLVTPSVQQRNVVLHPEFVQGRYGFYTRPQDNFTEAGKGGGIGFGLADNMEEAVITHESIIDRKIYHTVYELKNGEGPAPIKTPLGWLHLAHGVRNTAAGLRYVLYLFMTDLKDPSKQIYKPGGYFLAPEGEERIGDVSNVAFSNGWIADDDGTVFIYYASSDTRIHVAVSSIEKLLDYTIHTPADGFTSVQSVVQINLLIDKNLKLEKKERSKRLSQVNE